MQLIGSEVFRVSVPLITTFRTALREVHAVDEIRVKLITDSGLEGIGAAAPTAAITGDTVGSIEGALSEYLLPSLRAVDLSDQARTLRAVARSLVLNRSAKAAVDIALHDLYAKRAGQSLAAWLGAADGPYTLHTDATVSLNTPESMAAQAAQLHSDSFTTLKIKLGGHDGLDMVRMTKIRETVGPSALLRVDANQAWTVRECIRYLPELVRLGVELIEQPVQANDIEGLGAIARESPIPIVADETVFDLNDLLRVIHSRAADIINIKLMKTGGLSQARTMIALARSQDLKVMVGSMMEGVISVTAAVSLAVASHAEFLDLDAGYFLTQTDVDGGVRYHGSRIELPQALGLGITVSSDRDALQRRPQ